MLTPELVRARVQQGELKLTGLTSKTRERAQALAGEYLTLAEQNLGATREELRQVWGLVPVTPGERKLADGLLKLVEDACDFGSEVALSPPELRREVFEAASRVRQASGVEQPFDRDRVLQSVAARRGVEACVVEDALYADLKGAQKLRQLQAIDASRLLERYQVGQVQAVLLRAVRVVAEVHNQSPLAYRHLFNKLKFRQLLHRIEVSDTGYRITIDGPFSLFESVTKYGLQLALVLPALLDSDHLALEASLRWGKQRRELKFSFSHRGDSRDAQASKLPDEVERLRQALANKSNHWKISTCAEVLDLPGVGVCVPDLVFERPGERVYLEVLGYWSREAVWRRVELAQRGLEARVLFAVSSRLRVSEAVLENTDNAALYVFKGVMSPAQVLARIEALAASSPKLRRGAQ